ncbi:sugar ABC transporter ATP-binding protein [Clostridiaceae bacterium M8S5]|nr:sugar ABC transporter ATP-binding protein [Clostridiaceae bacterium M8S5]
MSEQFALQMKGIVKEYFGNKVLKGVDLCVKPGEIHGLLGENGAGKSTLMNVLFGMPVIYSTGGFRGEILIGSKKQNIKSPQDAMNLGIGMVHQEFMLIKGFTITENIKLNREITKENIVSRFFGKKLETLDFENMNKDSRKALDKLGLSVDEYVKIAGLPIGYMQFVEIAREIDKQNIKLLIFDEPTAVLTESEASKLLDSMKKIADSGIAILFITHRLDEVMRITDNITVLRDGELVKTVRTKDTNIKELAQAMVGRKLKSYKKNVARDMKDEVIMSIKNLNVNMPAEIVNGVDIDIRKGEILGIGGLAGQGKIGIANGIMGLYESSGEVIYQGEKLELNNTKDSLKKSIAFVSEDRRGVGLLLDSSIELNIAMTAMQIHKSFLRNLILISQKNTAKIRAHAQDMIKKLDIRCTGAKQLVKRLSGGNQQKICLARALTLNPNILFISEPTRGIDIGAKKIILELLLKLNQETNMTIIITSSELAELRSICDRIAIIYEGQVEGILNPDDSDEDFGLMMAGEYNKVHKGESV